MKRAEILGYRNLTLVLLWFSILLAMMCVPAGAQSKGTVPPAPRTADGHPDLSGDWEPPDGEPVPDLFEGVAGGAPFTPAGAAAFKINQTKVTDPEGLCIFTGTPRSSLGGYPFAIMQGPHRVAFLYELMTTYRIIPTDGREHPKEFEPSYSGDGIGRWDGDVLVIDTVGIKDHLSWLDAAGHPKSDALHITERWSRPDAKHLLWEATAEDPKFYTKPFKFSREFVAMQPGDRLLEFACDENNFDRDAGHLGLGVAPPDGTKPQR